MRRKSSVMLLSAILLGTFGVAAFAADVRPDQANNRGVVELETGGTAGISVRIAEEIASIVDDGATRRVLPVIGKGGQQNIADLRLLRGVDMAILQTDVLEAARQSAREGSLTYITKLYNEELHLLARRDIKSVTDLANQKVSMDQPGSGTATTAARLFGLLKLPVQAVNDDPTVGLEKLRKGEIAGLAFVSGRPAPLFRDVRPDEGLHLLAVPLQPEITAVYAPTRLTAADYPALVPADQPVDTVAVGVVLAVANLKPDSDRYHNVTAFIDAFFTSFDLLLEPGRHPKWREVNITADVPGLRRFPPADLWLRRNANVASQMSPQDFKAIFTRFIDERRQSTGGSAMSPQQKDELFKQFEKWQSEQQRR